MTKIYNFFFCIGLFLVVQSCGSSESATSSEVETSQDSHITVTQMQFDSSAFELGKAVSTEFPQSIRVFGKSHLPEKNKYVATTMISGIVGSINLIEGQTVRKGQVLFSIQNPELISMQEDYLIYKNKLPLLKEEMARQEEMFKANITSKKDLLASQMLYSETLSRLASLEEKFKVYGINIQKISNQNLVSRVYVTSPMSGFVSEINIHQGMHLDASTQAMLIAGTEDLHLELDVLEKDAMKLRHGQKVIFYVQNNMDQPLQAVVDVIKPEVNESHMVSIHCDILDKKGVLSGMYVVADLDLGDTKTLSLPEEAVVKSEGKSYVLKLIEKNNDGYHFERVMIQEPLLFEKRYSIIELDSSAQYLLQGAYFMM